MKTINIRVSKKEVETYLKHDNKECKIRSYLLLINAILFKSQEDVSEKLNVEFVKTSKNTYQFVPTNCSVQITNEYKKMKFLIKPNQ